MRPLDLNQALKSIQALSKAAEDKNSFTRAQQQRIIAEAEILINALAEADDIQTHSSNTDPSVPESQNENATSRHYQDDPAFSGNPFENNEPFFGELFKDAPVAIWVDDWSPVKQLLENLKNVDNWADYFNQYPDQLVQAYRSVKTITVNNTAVSLFEGDSVESLIKNTATEEIYNEELGFFLDQIVGFSNRQFSSIVEAKDITEGGEEIMVRRRTVMPSAHQKNWSRVIYTLEDVSERIKVEEQLRQSQKMEIVGQLTGGIAHDFNNLLAIIHGNAQLLADSNIEATEYTDPILHASGRGAELTQRLLAFSRKQPLKPAAVDLTTLLEDMSNILARTLGETIDIKLNINRNLWYALADPGQLENAVLNLAVNARDAMQEEGGSLTIKCENMRFEDNAPTHVQVSDEVNFQTGDHLNLDTDYQTGDYIVLSIADTGQGMTKEILDQVFEPFFTTKAIGMGTGLGLPMVYGFAKQSGGFIRISSEPGKGTEVQIYLNRTKKPEGKLEQQEYNQTVPQATGKRILVLEDDPRVCALVQQMLEKLGYAVVITTLEGEALETLSQSSEFDLVLSDVVLPDGTGSLEFLRKATSEHPGLKFVFMTGYSVDHPKLTNMSSAWPLLKKPFSMVQLENALNETLDQ